MMMKSVCGCLSFIDSMILCDIGKHAGNGNLEDEKEYMITIYNDNYIEDMMSMFGVFFKINLIIDRFYLDNESDIKKQCTTLRKRILARLQERNTITEEGDDEQSVIL